MTERKSKGAIEAQLDKVGVALLNAAYGPIMGSTDTSEQAVERPVPDGAEPATVNPNVFNAVVGWIRVKNKLEPDDDEESGLDKLTKRMKK